MDPLAKIANALQRQESRRSLEDTQEDCCELLKSRSGVLLTKRWKRQHFISDDKPRDLPASYLVSGTGISRSFGSEEEAGEFFRETARKHGRQRRREWWREWWPSVFVAAVILALVQQAVQWVPELIRWIAGR
ncbi:MAG: hypothetical protein OXH08_05180 [Gammaproteobacteria bacterium]|nr:hypothetical protein [Gammaproteobacteria bacterium]MDE0648839.1 hypothetical protein [Gammaproteobacteria bacterium]